MCNSIINRMLRRRQGLAYYLATEHLWATDIPAVTAKYIIFDAFQLQ